MQTVKIMQAVNGDRVQVVHPRLDLSKGMTSFTTVQFDGVAHSVISSPSTDGMNFANTTAEFAVNGMTARIVQGMDDVGVGTTAIRYQAVLEADSGALWLQSYDSADLAAEVLGAINPEATDLGIRIDPSDSCPIVGSVTVIFEIEGLGILDIVPLTRDVSMQLPDWSGTTVDNGELFAASMSRSVPYMIFVTNSARTYVLPSETVDIDIAAELSTELDVTWAP